MATWMIHHLERSRSHRVLWLLEELGADYEMIRHARTRAGRAPASLRAIHPLGKAPIVVYGDEAIIESGAILERILDAHPDSGLRPGADDPELQRYRFWMHYAEGSLMPPLLIKLLTGVLRGAGVPWFALPLTWPGAFALDRAFTDGEVAANLRFCDAALSDQDWFCGPTFTAADIQMGFPVEAAMRSRAQRQRYPNLARFVERVQDRSAYQRAVTAGGPVY